VLQFALVGASFAQAVEEGPDAAEIARRVAAICPTLPPASGLVWDYSRGPDFDLCYAVKAGSDETAFGVYFGTAPSFHPDKANQVGSGQVAGRRVTWYRSSEEGKPSPFGRETLVKFGSGGVSHVWVMASSQQQLDERLATIGGMQFRR